MESVESLRIARKTTDFLKLLSITERNLQNGTLNLQSILREVTTTEQRHFLLIGLCHSHCNNSCASSLSLRCFDVNLSIYWNVKIDLEKYKKAFR